MNDAVLIVDDGLTVRMDLVDAFEVAGFVRCRASFHFTLGRRPLTLREPPSAI